jgi:hypothetical protein
MAGAAKQSRFRKGQAMLKRHKLESVMMELADDAFATIWKSTYGNLPFGGRGELVRDFVAEQYDSELDACIAIAERLLTRAAMPAAKPKSKWLPPR